MTWHLDDRGRTRTAAPASRRPFRPFRPLRLLTLLPLPLLSACASVGTERGGRPTPRPEALVTDYVAASITLPPDSLELDSLFYRKYTDAAGIPVVGSARVPDAALLVARDIVVHMLLHRPDLREHMATHGQRVGIMSTNTVAEYWAEGTQWWFGSNYEACFDDVVLYTPEDLAAYDPELFRLLGRVYPDHRIPMDVHRGLNVRSCRAAARGR